VDHAIKRYSYVEKTSDQLSVRLPPRGSDNLRLALVGAGVWRDSSIYWLPIGGRTANPTSGSKVIVVASLRTKFRVPHFTEFLIKIPLSVFRYYSF